MKYNNLKAFLLGGNQVYPFQPFAQYSPNSFCLGSDGKIYQALATSTGQDPTTSPDAWEQWVEDLEPNKCSFCCTETTNASGQAVIYLTDDRTQNGSPLFTEAPFIGLTVKQNAIGSAAAMVSANYTLSADFKTCTIYTANAAAFVPATVNAFVKEA